MTEHDPAPPDAALQASLAAGLQALGLEASHLQRQQLIGHLLLIARWSRVYNLTAVRDAAQMVPQHLLDSLAVILPLRRELASWVGGAPSSGTPDPEAAPADPSTPPASAPLRLLDVGSGAGLPGVPLAILHPAWSVTCLDAVAKKVGFIRQVAAEWGLTHLTAEHRRVEAWNPPQRFHVITSRAFASLPDFVTLTRHLLAPGGFWMALKGQPPQDELTSLPPDIEVFHVERLQVPGLDAQRCLVWMRRRAA